MAKSKNKEGKKEGKKEEKKSMESTSNMSVEEGRRVKKDEYSSCRRATELGVGVVVGLGTLIAWAFLLGIMADDDFSSTSFVIALVASAVLTIVSIVGCIYACCVGYISCNSKIRNDGIAFVSTYAYESDYLDDDDNDDDENDENSDYDEYEYES